MQNLIRVFAIAFAFGGLTASAVRAQDAARTENVTVRAGQPQKIAFYPAAKADCSRAPLPEIKLVEEPKHGKLIVRRAAATAGPKSACPGQNIPGLLVLFVATPAYQGEDTLTFSVNRAETSAKVKLNIRVIAAPPKQPGMIDL